ncbi:MAG TPA: ABC transporter ATP-binding protein [Erysipelotrichaceae bacterium]|nr:ABC transporter ATP-binding protein [Erysipelotrichaceae bacterium]
MTKDNEKLFGDKKIPMKTMIKRLLYFILPEWKAFLLAFLLILVSVGISTILPLTLRDITDALGDLGKPLSFIIGLSIGYFVLSIVSQIIVYIQGMILQKTGQRIVYKLRMEVFTHIENMSQNQFNIMPVGSLVTRVANYTTAMSELFTNVIVSLLRNILTILGVYAIMFYLSVKLSLVLTLFVIVVFVSSFIFRKVITKIWRKERQYTSELNAFLNENLSGMNIIQIFNQEKRKEKEFNVKNEQLRKTKSKAVLAFAGYRPFITFLYYAALAVTFIVGIYLSLGAGEIVAFYLYLSRFFNPVQNIADQLNQIQRATTSSERLFNLLDVKPESTDKPNALHIDHFEGKIEFRNVWFAYKEDEWILKDVSFIVEPKQTVAFVGATGAGKTTILSLIVRNYEIQKGQILIDDIDIADLEVKCLRKAVGQMLQDVFLFTGTIRSNITLRDDSFTDEEIKEVCEYVNADKFIKKLPKGLEEEVIQRGENFSQGQRQLLSFARTVLHKPQILILDEATANIDTETEKLIQDSLEKIKNIGTMLVVAHRLSTIQNADQIIVLQHGEVIEKGTHQALLKKKGYYHKLFLLQFTDQIN